MAFRSTATSGTSRAISPRRGVADRSVFASSNVLSQDVIPSRNRPMRRPGHQETKQDEWEYKSKRVTQAAGGFESDGGVRFGVDKPKYASTTHDALSEPFHSPRYDPVAGTTTTTVKARATRPLVKPLQSIGGQTRVVLGSDKSSYDRSLHHEHLTSSAHPEAREALESMMMAGAKSSRTPRPLVKSLQGVGGTASVSLGSDRVELVSSERERADHITSPRLQEYARALPMAGGRVDPDAGLKVSQPPGGRQTFRLAASNTLDDRFSPRTPEYKSPRPTPRDPCAGISNEIRSTRESSLRVTQPVGGTTSVRLG